MDSAILFEYRIPSMILERAEKPIGAIPVRLGQMEIALTSVTQEGVASFYLPKEVHRKVADKEYEIRTLHYHPDEEMGDVPKQTTIVCLSVIQALRRRGGAIRS